MIWIVGVYQLGRKAAHAAIQFMALPRIRKSKRNVAHKRDKSVRILRLRALQVNGLLDDRKLADR